MRAFRALMACSHSRTICCRYGQNFEKDKMCATKLQKQDGNLDIKPNNYKMKLLKENESEFRK